MLNRRRDHNHTVQQNKNSSMVATEDPYHHHHHHSSGNMHVDESEKKSSSRRSSRVSNHGEEMIATSAAGGNAVGYGHGGPGKTHRRPSQTSLKNMAMRQSGPSPSGTPPHPASRSSRAQASEYQPEQIQPPVTPMNPFTGTPSSATTPGGSYPQRRPAYLLHRDLVIGRGSYGQVCIASRGEAEGGKSGKRKKFACKCVMLRSDPKYIAKLQEEVNVLREVSLVWFMYVDCVSLCVLIMESCSTHVHNNRSFVAMKISLDYMMYFASIMNYSL